MPSETHRMGNRPKCAAIPTQTTYRGGLAVTGLLIGSTNGRLIGPPPDEQQPSTRDRAGIRPGLGLIADPPYSRYRFLENTYANQRVW